MPLFVPLDVRWPYNPKVLDAGLEGAGLHAIALCLAKQLETDGVIARSQLQLFGATPELIDRMVEIGLFDAVDNSRIAVHDWLDRNPSAADLAANRSDPSIAGKRGNHKKWKHHGPFESCKICLAPDDPGSPSAVGSSHPRSGPESPPSRPPTRPDRSVGAIVGASRPESLSHSEERVVTTPSSSSSDSRGQRPPSDDDWEADRAQRVEEALAVLAGRDLSDRQCLPGRPPVVAVDRWTAKAVERRRGSHGDELARLAATDWTLSAEDLADVVDPRVEIAASDPLAGTRAAFDARCAEHAARRNGEPVPDVARNLTGLAAARGSMTRPDSLPDNQEGQP